MNNALRAVGDAVSVRDAVHIPSIGFGKTEITKRVGARGIVTEIVQRTFRLSCGCHVQEYNECGCVCMVCRAVLEDEQQGGVVLPTVGALMPVELDWMATPCLRHFRLCDYPFCSLGTCVRHCAQAKDGKYYCPPHFEEVEEAISLHELEARRGWGVAHGYKFFKSLFFD